MLSKSFRRATDSALGAFVVVSASMGTSAAATAPTSVQQAASSSGCTFFHPLADDFCVTVEGTGRARCTTSRPNCAVSQIPPT